MGGQKDEDRFLNSIYEFLSFFLPQGFDFLRFFELSSSLVAQLNQKLVGTRRRNYYYAPPPFSSILQMIPKMFEVDNCSRNRVLSVGKYARCLDPSPRLFLGAPALD